MISNAQVSFESNMNVNSIKIFNNTDLSYELAILSKNKTGADTILNTSYQDMKEDAYYISPMSGSNSIFTIYKKTPGKKFFQYIGTLDNGNLQMYDYSVENKQFYNYLCSIEITNDDEKSFIIYKTINDVGEETYFRVNMDNWSICDVIESDEPGVLIKSGHMWQLGLNLESEQITHNFGVSSWNTLGKYPQVVWGSQNYDSMTFTGLLGNFREYTKYRYASNQIINEKDVSFGNVCEYTEKMESRNLNVYDDPQTGSNEQWNVWNQYSVENEKLKAWKEFISNGETKLLRDTKGNSWLVQIVESAQSEIDNTSNLKQTQISFTWSEVMDITQYSVIYKGETLE